MGKYGIMAITLKNGKKVIDHHVHLGTGIQAAVDLSLEAKDYEILSLKKGKSIVNKIEPDLKEEILDVRFHKDETSTRYVVLYDLQGEE